MTLKELIALCEEAREVITSTVLKNGGHLSSNLGTVELTVALHYVSTFLKISSFLTSGISATHTNSLQADIKTSAP